MLNSVDFSGKPFHFIGIGGIGMSALAYVLAQRKLPVSGSDIRLGHITQRLAACGAHIFNSQDASNLKLFWSSADSTSSKLASAMSNYTVSCAEKLVEHNSIGQLLADKPRKNLPQVICSTAINSANLEYKAALDLGCPIFHRSELLAALIQEYYGIAVAGTHGKTTTSSMIGYLLLQAGLDPTIIVGGEVNAWGGNARLGQGNYLVAEADESDGSLINLAPRIGIVTNIELDHPDHYQTLDDVVNTFQAFARRCPTLVGCIDCPTVAEKLKPAVTYSINPDTGADYTVTDTTYSFDGTQACVWERGTVLGVINLQLLGQHNLSNALAAVAVGRLLGLEFSVIAQSLATFEGARRRFEWRGEAKGITFIDDYAHHPSEIRATLTAARLQVQPPARVVAIFQPHRYSRTLAFLSEFAQSFGNADQVIVSEIYSAGEPNLGQTSGRELADKIAKFHPQVTYQPSLAGVCHFLLQALHPGDLALFLGAGNLNQVIPEVIAALKEDKGQGGQREPVSRGASAVGGSADLEQLASGSPGETTGVDKGK